MSKTSEKVLLVIDDEKDLADVIREIVQGHFDRVEICYNGAEALEYIQKNEVTVILSDISMPEMTGDQLLRKMRMIGCLTPIVFLTGNATKDVVISALKLGASDFLEKPFDPLKLIETLEMALSIERHRSEIAVLEKSPNPDSTAIRSEKKSLGLKQVVRDMKKSS